jgi:hypothetical protein
MRAALAAARVVRRFVASPEPPRVGEPLRQLYLKHLACPPGREGVLFDLLRNLLNGIRRRGTHNVVWGAFFPGDPHLDLCARLQHTRASSTQLYASGDTAFALPPSTFAQRPAYADFSLV